MKPFDKRSVPGLEDCSSDSDSDNETINKKLRHDDGNDDVEIELEVKNNEFLKEEPVSNDTLVKKRSNFVWSEVAQSEILDESIRKVSVYKNNVKRSVESYNVSDDYRNKTHCQPNKNPYKKNRFQQKQNRKIPVKDRIIHRTFDKNKTRNHININPETQSPSEIVYEIARILIEPKVELIERCYNVLGFDKCLEFLYMTEDIEESGGLLVLNGSRRRSPGGVFLNLIKESKDIRLEDLKRIFAVNIPNKKMPNRNGNNLGSRASVKNNQLPKSQPPLSLVNEQNSQQMLCKDEELEEGEIP